ncbi:MAG: lysophospholipid acyltransferase family protein [Elusimicrobiota bacterium]
MLKFKKWVVRSVIYLAAVFLMGVVNLLPWRIASFLGGIIGGFVYYLLPRERRISQQNLTLAFPEKDQKEIVRLARESFVFQGRNLFELLSFRKLNKKKINSLVTVEGRINLDEAFSKGKGMIFVTGHIGNWELLAAWLTLNGFPVYPIARRVYDDRLNKILLKLRGGVGVQTILRSESPFAILRTLRKKAILGFLPDQTISGPGVNCVFFGHPAYTSLGLASLAQKTGTPVVAGFISRNGCKHKFVIGEEIKFISTGDTQKDAESNTQIVTTIIEEAIRRQPAQWVWMHRRWK